MKYYIVALFDEDSYESLNPIQKKVSKKFKAHRNSPLAHITLNIIENPNMEKLNTIMEKNLKPYKKFKVQTCNNITISESLKNVNLKIENLGYIKKIERNINDSLEKAQSLIGDADIAEEMMKYTTNQTLAQAAISLMTQSNQLPQDALQILRNVR